MKPPNFNWIIDYLIIMTQENPNDIVLDANKISDMSGVYIRKYIGLK